MPASTAQSIRISAEDFKKHFDDGDSMTILDMRSTKAYESSDVRIPGDVRVIPEFFAVDSRWPKEQLAVVY